MPRAQKVGDVLVITHADGRKTELRDKPYVESKPTDIDVRHYEYVGFEPAIGQHVVRVGYWEGGTTLLIDERSGRREEVCNPPVVAPDRRRFACVAGDPAYTEPVVQVWRVEPDRLVRELEQPDDLFPRQATWLDEKRVRVGVAALSGRVIGWRLFAMDDGHWRLAGSCGETKFHGGPDTEPPAGAGSAPKGCERGEQPLP